MEIINMIRGHLALLVDKPMTTPVQNKEFCVESVGDWQIYLNISAGKPTSIYISDILRVYMYIFGDYLKTKTQSEVDKFVKSGACIGQGITSYVIPLLGTFSDIEITKEPKLTIGFIKLG